VADIGSYLDRLTKKQLIVAVTALALDKGVDVATGGALNRMTKKVLVETGKRLILPIAPFAGRAGVSVAGTALGMSRLALTNPYVVGGTLLYLGYTERDRIAQALADGAEIVEDPLRQYLGGVEQRGREFLADPIGAVQEMREERKRFQQKFPSIRKASKFNKAVSAGMKAVKKSTTYGGKGKIRPAKKVFAMVTKLASAKKKKKKAPKKGIRRLIWNAMKGLR